MSLWCSDVGCWCSEGRESPPQGEVFVEFVPWICTVCVGLEKCRRGDLNPLSQTTQHCIGATLLPHNSNKSSLMKRPLFQNSDSKTTYLNTRITFACTKSVSYVCHAYRRTSPFWCVHGTLCRLRYKQGLSRWSKRYDRNGRDTDNAYHGIDMIAAYVPQGAATARAHGVEHLGIEPTGRAFNTDR